MINPVTPRDCVCKYKWAKMAWIYNRSLAAMIFSVLWLWLAVVNAQQMAWVSSTNSTALCNDFTRAGFFIRRNESSRDWMVFLESGGLCYNTQSCNRRFFVRQVGENLIMCMPQSPVKRLAPRLEPRLAVLGVNNYFRAVCHRKLWE